MSIKNQAAVVGVGATPYYKRGQSYPETEMSMACTAILRRARRRRPDRQRPRRVRDLLLRVRSRPRWRRSSACPRCASRPVLTSGGGGCAGALGLAAAAIHAGMANVCVIADDAPAAQPAPRRLRGRRRARLRDHVGGRRRLRRRAGMSPSAAFTANAGLLSPGHSFSVLTQRHMHLYGTKREHFAEVAHLRARERHPAAGDRAADRSRCRSTTTSRPA